MPKPNEPKATKDRSWSSSVRYLPCRVEPGMFNGEYLVYLSGFNPKERRTPIAVQLLADQQEVAGIQGTPKRNQPVPAWIKVMVAWQEGTEAGVILPQAAQPVGEQLLVDAKELRKTMLAEQLKQARVIDLEQPRFQGMPIHPSHRPGYFYALHRRHRDTYQPTVHGPRSGASGVVTMIEHSGTHIDALCHQACGLKIFGNLDADSIETPAGFTQLGVERVPPLVTRGFLLDMAAWKGQALLPRHYSISADELIACANAENVRVEAGDVLLVRTGYDTMWHDEEAYLQAAGIGKSATLWAAESRVAAVGADNMAWDAPMDVDPETGATLFAHIHLLTQKGIYIIENLDLRELAALKQYTFAFIGIPLKFQGATGSPLRPIALI